MNADATTQAPVGGSGGADAEQVALGRRLKELREYLGLPQQFVTSATGIPRSAVSEIERGNRKVDSLELRKLARVYKTSVTRLLEEDPAVAPAFEAIGRTLAGMSEQDQAEVLRFAEYLAMTKSAPRGR
ncbi:helix-turn-helix domain-containing protein [Janibacter indicus]|uniref:helix-turn-helix domain-containing protein n=1 Tax=Janibacter indicus TaxID=857417 RepID=UPI003D9AA9E7